MSKVLIDSSAWIHYFKYGESALANTVNLLLDNDQAVICGMVELEILQGLRDHEKKLVQDLFSALNYISAEREDFIAAGNALNQLRRKRITIPSSDCLIGLQCQRRNLRLLTLDKDFDHLPQVKKYSIDYH